MSSTSSHIYQNALLSTELQEIFQNAPPNPASNVTPNENVVMEYKILTDESAASSKRRSIEDHDCPICYESFKKKEKTDYCQVCGNSLHVDCLKMWKSHNANYPCPVCRAPKLGGETIIEGYTNLADYQPGTNREREV